MSGTGLPPRGITPDGPRAGRAARPRARLGGRRREDGASAVESVLVAPLLLLLVFGVIEVSALFYDWTLLRSSTSDAARAGSSQGSAPTSDWAVLRQVRNGSTKFIGRVRGVVIFKAATPDSQPPAACVSAAISGGAGQAGVCNVYGPADLLRPKTDFGKNPAVYPTAIDRFWEPTGRVDWLDGPPDLVGVTVVLKHPALSGIFPTITLTETAIIPVEPRRSSL